MKSLLSGVENRYSQIDEKVYFITFGIRKFHQYLYGRKFTLTTDNKPISQIFSESKGLPTMSAIRMQHYAAFLHAFDSRSAIDVL
uniref:RT_RNaseH domain-containing protein n=1 Tax=Anopheles stephensi TaxID=30069 RepID=A0A182YRA0_ANOST